MVESRILTDNMELSSLVPCASRSMIYSMNDELHHNDDNEDEDVLPKDFPWNEEEATKGRHESWNHFFSRHIANIRHFLLEGWGLSALLGFSTAILSITTDIGIESILHLREVFYDKLHSIHPYFGLLYWLFHFVFCIAVASNICKYVSPQAVGSGIPEVKVIISGFVLKNYLSLRTLAAKMFGLMFTIGGGLPVGKEGPFVHMGAIVASLLSKATASLRINSFFSNESREIEMLSMGCAVGIACTFSAPVGAVMYGIECTSKYFLIKNYWKIFFASTCAAISFRLSLNVLIPPHIRGTIVAYYQTNFPNEVFTIEETPLFALLGVFCGLFGALFVFVNRQIFLFQKNNQIFQSLFGSRMTIFTVLWALNMAIWTYPEGFGRYVAGKYTFHTTLADFISNCTLMTNDSLLRCTDEMYSRWNGGDGSLSPFLTFSFYILFYFLLVAQCITLFIPSGIFVPAFAVGACGGRLMGEALVILFPYGLRGTNPIHPGLYAVVAAAAYTGAVTHSLSIAVIVCETTGQYCALLPVIIALMIANAICSFLVPSIYESTIILKNLPYLTHLPPSRVTAHLVKVERVMVKDVFFVSRETTIEQLRDILTLAPRIKSFPFVTDTHSMNLLGSVTRRYLVEQLLSTLDLDTLTVPRTDRMFNLGGTAIKNGETVERKMPATRTPSELLYLLSSKVVVEDANIDPAPFQLVKGTSLYRVHTLFSLLGLHHAYVTDRGRLLGVISLKELREAFAGIYTKGVKRPLRKKTTVASRLGVPIASVVNAQHVE